MNAKEAISFLQMTLATQSEIDMAIKYLSHLEIEADQMRDALKKIDGLCNWEWGPSVIGKIARDALDDPEAK